MRSWIAAIVVFAASCGDTRGPLAIRLGQDACAHCRMVIASRLTAAQIDAPGDEPRFFDEIGCLRDYLANLATPLTEGAVVFVADHRTGDWVDANRAIFTRTAIQTPMASGIVAHADERSRDADLSLSVGTPVGREDILRPARQRGAS